MFGRILRLIPYGIAVILLLFIGNDIITYAVWSANQANNGDIMPLILATILASTLLGLDGVISGRNQKSIPLKVFKGFTWVTAIVLILIGYALGMKYYSIIGGLIGGTIAFAFCRIVNNPSNLEGLIESVKDARIGFNKVNDIRVLILHPGAREKVIEIIKERPKLPVSITRYRDIDSLVLRANCDEASVNKTCEIIETAGISIITNAAKSLTQFVLAQPLLNEAHGLALSDYRIVTNPKAVESLLINWPIRMTVHPTPKGLVSVVRAEDALGLDVEEIPSRLLDKVVVQHDVTVLKLDKGDDQINPNAES